MTPSQPYVENSPLFGIGRTDPAYALQ